MVSFTEPKRTMVRLYSRTRVTCVMSQRPLLPMVGDQPERRDAARNREVLLKAAQGLVEHCGVDSVTMDAVAQKAGVGKGTSSGGSTAEPD